MRYTGVKFLSDNSPFRDPLMPPCIPYQYQTLTVRQASREAKVSVVYIRRLCHEGKIEWYREGWCFNLSRPSFDRWKEARKESGPRRVRQTRDLMAA